jgi:acyl carrier protein
MTTPDATVQRILALAAEHFPVPAGQLSPDDALFTALGIDSLKALELLSLLEQHFGVELPDWEMQGVSDFRTLAERTPARLFWSFRPTPGPSARRWTPRCSAGRIRRSSSSPTATGRPPATPGDRSGSARCRWPRG